MTTRVLFFLLCCAVVVLLQPGCKTDPPPGLYDPSYVSGPQPKVTSIDPAANALAGVTALTINGSNFSATPGNNLVFFDNVRVSLTSATTTQLKFKAPILPKDSIKVKVAVQGSDLFSEVFLYNLGLAADEKFGNFASGEEPVGMDCDASGNLYVSMLANGLGIGVKKFTTAGLRSDYSPAFSGAVASWRGMKVGSGGAIFAVAARAIVFRIPPGGGAAGVWTSGSGLGNLYDLDFDANGNLWTGGPSTASGAGIFRIRPDKAVRAFQFAGTVRSVRVFNGYLYVGGKRDSLEKVWRYPFVATDSLGAEEEYFNVSTRYGANTFGVYAITFSNDGDLYVGTDAPDGILLVHPDKSSEPYYPGIITPHTVAMAWGSGSRLYQSRGGLSTTKTVVDINALKTGAPYYGRTLP
jgi:hypothetical protein